MALFRKLAPALLALALVLLPRPSRAEEAILLYSSSASVREDASLEVREDITVRVEGRRIRKGIFRDFPTTYRDSSGKIVRVGFSVEEALLNGKRVPYSTESRSNGVRVYLGDPKRNAPLGEQTYTLVYVTTGQLGFFDEHDELYWNVTGNEWVFPILKARFSASLPGNVPFSSVDFYTGPQGARGKSARILPDNSVETTRRLAPGEGLTVAYTWPKGIVEKPKPPMRFAIFDRFGNIFFWSVPLLLLLYYVLAWIRWGKDPPRKPVIPLFAPSAGNGPGFLRFVRRMGMDNACFTAEILNLAVKGFLKIEEMSLEESMQRQGEIGEKRFLRGMVSLASKLGSKRYALLPLPKEGWKTPPSNDESRLFNTLFGQGGNELHLVQYNHEILGKAKDALEASWSTASKPLFSKNTPIWAAGFLIPALLYALLAWGGHEDSALLSAFAVGGILVAGRLYTIAWKKIRGRGRILRKIITAFIPAIFTTVITLLFLAAITMVSGWHLVPPLATGLIILVFRELMTVRTEKGNDVLGEADGLAMYMGTAERHRLEMFNPPEETPEVFERLLPYAFALDTAETWANRFEEILRQQQYQPEWYSGPSAATFYAGGAAASLASSMSSTIASASQAPGSSSGSGGGGSSGGGGGGGGGGGW
ncbi:DUF2207 domain-containing protein [Aminivibrio sp.]|jgi:uncharacterized membrane protein YgcG|uniref:DUF2207 domain-containing protein n=1 Tax=Aminivibrio sp. TaxID=1872489 RepID=UPI001A47A873|nr:DUF2207 domain-containing protein [Aminivibrio sp.]MBL3540613.1 DUF2207 domain-containing protein [Aminivibrio sp.]